MLSSLFDRIAVLVAQRKFEYVISGALLLLALFFAAYHLVESPAIWYDEGFYTQLALNAAHGNGFRIQVAPHTFVSGSGVTVGYPLTALVALSYQLFGPSVFAGRAVMVVFILALLIAAYFLTRRLFGAPAAMLSGLLLATFPVLYGDGKSVLGEVPGMVFIMLTLLMMLSLERREWRGAWRFALLGLFAGLAVVTKPIYILLLPAALVGILWRGRTFFFRPAGIAIGAAAFLVAFGIWVATQFTSTDSLSAILAFYVNPYEAGNIAHLMFENALRFVKESSPLYLLVFLGIWWVSMFLRRARLTAVECMAAAFALLIVLFYLRTPGWYRYFFPAQIVAIAYMPAALLFLAHKTRERFMGALPAVGKTAFAALAAVLLVALGAVQLYQLSASSYVASYYGSARTAAVKSFFASLPQRESIFAYNVPEIVVFFGGREYYQYLAPHPDQLFGAEELPLLASGAADIVIADNATYRQNPAPFSAYIPQETIGNHYVVLVKKTALPRRSGI